ncbi:MAG: LysR family transcriptional regulator [Myxococcota bacterium]
MREELDGLRRMAIFAAVVEAQSFSEAARRMGMAKSAVSKQVSELEHVLGVRLMNRTTRRLSLTEAGERYHQSCTRILREAVEATRAVRSLQTEPVGTLRLNASISFGERFVVPQVVRFMEAYPEIQVELDLIDHYVDMIDDNVDLAIRIGHLEDSSLVARKLAPISIMLVAAPDFFEAHGRPSEPSEVESLPLIRYTENRGRMRVEVAKREARQQLRFPDARVQSNSGASILRLTQAGLGLSLLPDFFVNADLASGRLVRVLPEWDIVPPTAVHAVYPHSRNVQNKVRIFVDFLAEAYRSPPWHQER